MWLIMNSSARDKALYLRLHSVLRESSRLMDSCAMSRIESACGRLGEILPTVRALKRKLCEFEEMSGPLARLQAVLRRGFWLDEEASASEAVCAAASLIEANLKNLMVPRFVTRPSNIDLTQFESSDFSLKSSRHIVCDLVATLPSRPPATPPGVPDPLEVFKKRNSPNQLHLKRCRIESLIKALFQQAPRAQNSREDPHGIQSPSKMRRIGPTIRRVPKVSSKTV